MKKYLFTIIGLLFLATIVYAVEKPLAPNQLATSPVAGYLLKANTATSTTWVTPANILSGVLDNNACLGTNASGNIISFGTTTTYNNPEVNNASTYLALDSYDGSDQVIHPDIYVSPTTWNGYKYWMLFEPYPDSSDVYEDPSILVSNDNSTWIVPPGGTNPIVAQGYPTGFNSDGDMTLVGNTMYVFYRYNVYGDEPRPTTLKVASSTDGVTWTTPIDAFTLQYSKLFASPSVIYEDGVYSMFSVDTLTDEINLATSTDAINWTATTTVAYYPNAWHIDVNVFNGLYQMVITTQTNLIYFYSTNKTTWQYGGIILGKSSPSTKWDGGTIYRPTFWVEGDDFRLWYSAMSGAGKWHIGYTEDASWTATSTICGKADKWVDTGGALVPNGTRRLTLNADLNISRNAVTGALPSFNLSLDDLPSGVQNVINNFNSYTGLLIRPTGTSGGDPLVVKSYAGTTKLAVDGATGFVGIGTSTPVSDLTVVGTGADIYVQQPDGSYSVTFASRDDGSGILRILDNSASIDTPKIQFDSIGVSYINNDQIFVIDGTAQLHAGYGFQVGTTTLLNDNVRIDGTTVTLGNVTIGSTTDTSYPLSIIGDSADLAIRQTSGNYSVLLGSRADGSGFLRLLNDQADYNDDSVAIESKYDSYISTGKKFFIGVKSEMASAPDESGVQFATSTYVYNNLAVRGTSTLATILGSSITVGYKYLSGGIGDFVFPTIYSVSSTTLGNLSGLMINNSTFIIEDADQAANPSLVFASANFADTINTASIEYATTSEMIILSTDYEIQGTGTSTMAGNLDVAGTIEASNTYTGDLHFANGWRITEAEKLGRNYSGLVIFDGENNEIGSITKDGFINKAMEDRLAKIEKKLNDQQSLLDLILSYLAKLLGIK